MALGARVGLRAAPGHPRERGSTGATGVASADLRVLRSDSPPTPNRNVPEVEGPAGEDGRRRLPPGGRPCRNERAPVPSRSRRPPEHSRRRAVRSRRSGKAGRPSRGQPGQAGEASSWAYQVWDASRAHRWRRASCSSPRSTGSSAWSGTIDDWVGRIKVRDRGLSAGEVVMSMAECMLAGGDFRVPRA